VPDLTGRTMQEVEMALEDAHLRWRILDTLYSADLKPSEVISQEPPASSKVKEGRVIYLTVNAAKPPEVAFPPIKEGTALRNAMNYLKNEGFVVKEVEYIPWRYTSVKYAEVTGRRAVPGRKYPMGTEVVLFVGSGLGDQYVSVPNLISKTLDEAEFFLHAMNLTVGFIEYDRSIVTYRDSVDAIIYRQSPSATEGATLRIGEVVDVWLINRKSYTPEPPADDEE